MVNKEFSIMTLTIFVLIYSIILIETQNCVTIMEIVNFVTLTDIICDVYCLGWGTLCSEQLE